MVNVDEPKSVSVISSIHSCYKSLYAAEKRVADQILGNSKEVIRKTVTELAEQSAVSDATIVRFCQKIGYKGFQQLKIALAQEVVDPVTNFSPTIDITHTEKSIQNIFMYKIKSLQDTANFLKANEVEECVKLIMNCNHLYLFAAGNSIPVALDAAYKLTALGIHAITNILPEMQISSARLMTNNDVAMAISHSGSAKSVLTTLEIARKNGAKSICITNYYKSPIAKLSDRVLCTVSNDDAFFDDFTYSRIPAIAVIDTLFLLITKMKPAVFLNNIQENESELSEYKL
jgi:RpiR family carbohydrate utilization transcriptional regulator